MFDVDADDYLSTNNKDSNSLPWYHGMTLDTRWSKDTSCNYCDVFRNSVEGCDTIFNFKTKNTSLCYIITYQFFSLTSRSTPPPDMAIS